MMALRKWGTGFRLYALAALSFVVCVGSGSGALAQALRDPTVAPAGVAGSMRAGGGDKGVSKVMSVMVVDGRPFVVAGSRLYAQGDKLGQATVERISETQIWLREGKQLRKIDLYSGVQRQPHAVSSH